jgi:hypothetical protein
MQIYHLHILAAVLVCILAPRFLRVLHRFQTRRALHRQDQQRAAQLQRHVEHLKVQRSQVINGTLLPEEYYDHRLLIEANYNLTSGELNDLMSATRDSHILDASFFDSVSVETISLAA